MLVSKLIKYIDTLTEDIDRLRETKSYNFEKNQQRISDANLVEDIKNDLIKLVLDDK